MGIPFQAPGAPGWGGQSQVAQRLEAACLLRQAASPGGRIPMSRDSTRSQPWVRRREKSPATAAHPPRPGLSLQGDLPDLRPGSADVRPWARLQREWSRRALPHLDQFALQNLIDLLVQMRWNPLEKLGIDLTYHRFWLHEENDFRWAETGAFSRRNLGFVRNPSNGSNDAGHERDLRLRAAPVQVLEEREPRFAGTASAEGRAPGRARLSSLWRGARSTPAGRRAYDLGHTGSCGFLVSLARRGVAMPIFRQPGFFGATMARLEGPRIGFTSFGLLGAIACGPSETTVGAVRPAEALVVETEAEDVAEVVSGTYQVDGVTVQAANGRQRAVAGTLELRVEGGRYEVSFDLATTAPDPEGLPITVAGNGRGWVVDGGPGSPRVLAGTTEEVMAIDPARAAETTEEFATSGLKIVSTSQAHFNDDGAVVIHLQNQASEGVGYSPSVTTLVGRRVGELSDVAASPPSDD